MPQSLSLLIVHVIFSTEGRASAITDEIREPLHRYLAVLTRDAGCECYRVGGNEDHVHLAVRLSRTLSVAKLIEKIKSNSSRWVKLEFDHQRHFSWQHGYAAISVGPRDLQSLLAYIDRQEEHHRKMTFQDELRGLLRECGMEFDERYLWD